jgi:hypothetical protein
MGLSIGLLTQPGKWISEVQENPPAFAHGGIHGTESQAPALRDNGIIVTGSASPYVRRGKSFSMPTYRQDPTESDVPASGGPTRDYLEATRTFWQPYADRELTREDAREMAHNLLGFFTVLREWTIRERARVGIAPSSSPPPRKRGKPRKNGAAPGKVLP